MWILKESISVTKISDGNDGSEEEAEALDPRKSRGCDMFVREYYL